MRQFLKHTVIFSIPFVLIIFYYIADDPFLLWRNNGGRLFEYGLRHQCVNDAYRGIRLLNQHDDSLHYNSFIVGSSRSDFYYIDEWKKYIGEDAICFHFSQSAQNIVGMAQQVDYLLNRYSDIKNLLLIMDTESLGDTTTHTGHLFRQPWQVSGLENFVQCNREYIKAFYTLEYQKYIWYGKAKNEMYFHYDYSRNELYKDEAECLLNSIPDSYYAHFENGINIFYKRDSTEHTLEPIIKQKQLKLLTHLAKVIKSRDICCKVVIGPLYNQQKLNSKDYYVLVDLFGMENVLDCSGINQYTEEISNYYETSHYRPHVCKSIIEQLYSK